MSTCSSNVPPSAISRREALRRIGLLVGGTLAAPTVAGVLSGCRAEQGADWSPAAFSANQDELVTTISEQIIPATDTPGAREAQVNRFIDKMLAEWHTPEDRQRFLDGIDAMNEQCRERFGSDYLACAPEEQTEVLTRLDRAAFATAASPAQEEEQEEEETEEQMSRRGLSPDDEAEAEAELPADSLAVARMEATTNFFRMMKEMTLAGYYTSEVGATEELRWLAAPGRFDGCIPFEEVGRAWA